MVAAVCGSVQHNESARSKAVMTVADSCLQETRVAIKKHPSKIILNFMLKNFLQNYEFFSIETLEYRPFFVKNVLFNAFENVTYFSPRYKLRDFSAK